MGNPRSWGDDGVPIPVAFLNADIGRYQTSQGRKTTNEFMRFLREWVGEAEILGQPCVPAIEITHT